MIDIFDKFQDDSTWHNLKKILTLLANLKTPESIIKENAGAEKSDVADNAQKPAKDTVAKNTVTNIGLKYSDLVSEIIKEKQSCLD